MSENSKLALTIIKSFFLPVLLLSIIGSYLLLPLYDYVVPKNYSAKSQFLVTPKEELVNKNSFDQSTKYISNYNVLIYGDNVLSKVQEKMGGKSRYSIEDIKSHLVVLFGTDSQIITVQIITNDKQKSIKLANTILDTAMEEIPAILSMNNLKVVTRANRCEQLSTMTRKSFFILTILMFGVTFSLVVVYQFFIKQKLVFNGYVRNLVGSSHIYEL